MNINSRVNGSTNSEKRDSNNNKKNSGMVAGDYSSINQASNGGKIMRDQNITSQYNNCGAVNSYTVTLPEIVENEDEQAVMRHDRDLYNCYCSCLTADQMNEFIDTLLSGSVWGIEVSDKVIRFLELASSNSVNNHFFDNELEKRRETLGSVCDEFYNKLKELGGPVGNGLEFSLRNEIDNHREELKQNIDVMTPLANRMYKSYYDLVKYAQREKLFI